MRVWVVIDSIFAIVHGVYTTERRALAKREELSRDMPTGIRIQTMELNSGTQDESGPEGSE